jgi:hypothetical protein
MGEALEIKIDRNMEYCSNLEKRIVEVSSRISSNKDVVDQQLLDLNGTLNRGFFK